MERRATAMRTMLQREQVLEIQSRLERLHDDSERQWGTMTPAQALAHCCGGMRMAMGEIRPPRKLIGRVLGPLIKPVAFKEEEPMRRNSPTSEELLVTDGRDLNVERERLLGLVERFAAGGPAACTEHPHAFFGRLTPEEWGVLMYKHLDHHLRQFGV